MVTSKEGKSLRTAPPSPAIDKQEGLEVKYWVFIELGGEKQTPPNSPYLIKKRKASSTIRKCSADFHRITWAPLAPQKEATRDRILLWKENSRKLPCWCHRKRQKGTEYWSKQTNKQKPVENFPKLRKDFLAFSRSWKLGVPSTINWNKTITIWQAARYKQNPKSRKKSKL